MDKMSKKKLETVAEVIDSLHRTPKYSGSGYPMVRVTDIKLGYLNLENCLRVSEEIYNDFSKKHKSKAGDIVFSRVGSEGLVSLVEGGQPFCLGQNTAFIVPKIGNNYLYYWLQSPSGISQIRAKTTGSSQRTISLESIRSLDVDLPSAKEQNRISEILSAYDLLIQKNAHRIRILEDLMQLIYTEWFIDFRFPGHKKVQFVNSGASLGSIPEGWRVSKHKDVIKKIVLGGTPSRSNDTFWSGGTIPWIKSGKLNDLRVIDETEFITELGLERSASKLMPRRTVLIAITGAILISISEIELCANQSVIGLYDSEHISQEYLYFHEKNIINEYIGKMSGSAQQHINKEIIEEADILVPSPEIVNKFSSVIEPMFDELANLLFQNKNLKLMRDLLIPKLINE